MSRPEAPPSPKTTLTGADVRRIRNERGLSQGELAAKLGVTVSYVCHIEQGASLMTLQFEAAIQWVKLTGGATLPGACEGCGGRGVHRRPPSTGCAKPKHIRCDACGGTGEAAGDGRVILA